MNGRNAGAGGASARTAAATPGTSPPAPPGASLIAIGAYGTMARLPARAMGSGPWRFRLLSRSDRVKLALFLTGALCLCGLVRLWRGLPLPTLAGYAVLVLGFFAVPL